MSIATKSLTDDANVPCSWCRSWWLHRQKLRGCHWGHWDFHGFYGSLQRATGIKMANRNWNNGVNGQQDPTRSNKYLVICWWYRHVSRSSHRLAMFCSWLHNLKIWSTLFLVWAITIVVVGKTGTFFCCGFPVVEAANCLSSNWCHWIPTWHSNGKRIEL